MFRFSILAAVVALVTSACSETKTKTCGETGVVCAEGWVCIEDLSHCIDPTQTLCGNGIPEGNEECDDGNFINGDGCSWNCELPRCGDNIIEKEEYTIEGITYAAEFCDNGPGAVRNKTQETAFCNETCTAPDCGDGEVNQARGEVCDPDQRCQNGDLCGKAGRPSCSDGSACKVRAGYGCSTDCRSAEICGDGYVNSNPHGGWGPLPGNPGVSDFLTPGEKCDPGRTCANGTTCTTDADCDGSTNSCAVRTTLNCTKDCTSPNRCGDSVVNAGELFAGTRTPESCDDGNDKEGDGCSEQCQVEDGWTCDTPGAACYGTCGDGVVVRGEDCDDHNTDNGDGCSSNCRVEEGYDCPTANAPCDVRIGDFKVVRGFEDCDDGNKVSGDGCSATGTVEEHWVCPTEMVEGISQPIPGSCSPICGDGQKVGAEVCDDGNTTAGDGCDPTCRIKELGWTCDDASPTVCAPKFGDKIVVGNEQCDEGDIVSPASPGCQDGAILTGWVCPTTLDSEGQSIPAAGRCSPICGDGRKLGDEVCDDGNTAPNDGCDPTCRIKETGWDCDNASPTLCAPIPKDTIVVGPETCDEGEIAEEALRGCQNGVIIAGWTCPKRLDDAGELQPAAGKCSPICGDGQKLGDEVCDDGNTGPGDGCSNSCQLEQGWNCDGASPTTCTPVFGDGIVVTGETCDEGTAPTPGCSSDGKVAPGWDCPVRGGKCKTICGDGVTLEIGGEYCDDGKSCADGTECTEDAACEGIGNGACEPQDGITRCADNTACADATSCANIGDGECKIRRVDGCSKQCQRQTGWTCNNVTVFEENPLTPPQSVCTEPLCGDGIQNGDEECDPGLSCANLVTCTTAVDCSDGTSATDGSDCIIRSRGGCTLSCLNDDGWENGHPKCGDRLLRGNEQCDDGNSVAGDGCSASCMIEPAWTCQVSPPLIANVCTPICGDGVKVGVEQCDDDNLLSGDGCNANCELETGWTCGAPGDACTPICGDGLVRGDEVCDEGAGNPTAGCAADCKTMAQGWTCTPGQSCTAVCGDRLVIAGSETCDDGNKASGDGCGATCQVESGSYCNAPTPERGSVCATCVSSISSCVAANDCGNDANATVCTQCADGMKLGPNGKSCVACAPNEYGNGVTCNTCSTLGGCQSANTRCESPSGGSPACTVCTVGAVGTPGYMLDPATHTCSACAAGTYGNGYSCTSCAPIAHCGASQLRCEANATTSTCNQCEPGYQLSGDKKTCTACPSGQWSNGSTCQACTAVSGCAASKTTCDPTTGQNSVCSTCTAGSGLVDGACTTCADGTWSDGTTSCQPCAGVANCSGAVTCNKSTGANAICGTCAPGFYGNGTGTCAACTAIAQCEPGALTCTAANNATCSTCTAGYHLTVNAKACKAECGDGVITAGEECDTGNTVGQSSSGCTAQCQRKDGYYCSVTSPPNPGPTNPQSTCATCASNITNCATANACQANPAATTCTACTPGFGLAGDGKSCTACTAGNWSNGTTACTACPAVPGCQGSVTCDAGTGANAQCSQCSDGQKRRPNGTCEDCPAGTFGNGGSTCTPCPLNTYSAAAAGSCTAWTTCNAGQYVNNTPNATTDRTCAACGAGTFSTTQNAASCTSWTTCGSGKRVTNTPNATTDRTCTDCAAGTANNTQNAATCAACNTGTYSGPGAATCAPWTTCSAGQYVTNTPNATTNRTCAPCGPQSFSTTQNAASCTSWATCNAGQYVSTPLPSATTDRTCATCGTGTFSTTQNAGSCTPWTNCGDGQHVSTPPASTTTDRTCAPCAGGTANNTQNAATCAACNAGTYSGPGATTCAACAADHYSGDGAPTCIECPTEILGCPSGNFSCVADAGPACSSCATGLTVSPDGTECGQCVAASDCSSAPACFENYNLNESTCETPATPPCAVGEIYVPVEEVCDNGCFGGTCNSQTLAWVATPLTVTAGTTPLTPILLSALNTGDPPPLAPVAASQDMTITITIEPPQGASVVDLIMAPATGSAPNLTFDSGNPITLDPPTSVDNSGPPQTTKYTFTFTTTEDPATILCFYLSASPWTGSTVIDYPSAVDYYCYMVP